MTPAYALALMSVIIFSLHATNQQQIETFYDQKERSRVRSVEVISQAVRDFSSLIGRYPADLAELSALDQFAYIAPYINRDVEYVLAEDIQDGSYQFDRVAVYSRDPKNTDLTDAQLLLAANNPCGNQDFDQGQSFCFQDTPHMTWWVGDTRPDIMRQITLARSNLARSVIPFITSINVDGGAPFTRSDGTEMSAGESDLLINIVGYAGPANGCTGVWPFQSTLLGCEDLFSPVSGAPVTYTWMSLERFILSTNSGLVDGGGAPITVAQELNLESA